jgi:hypothetical protein
MAAMVVLFPWFIWKLATDHTTRHAAGQSMLRSLKGYLIFGAVGWVISKIWRKPKENDSGEEPSVPSSKQKNRRKNNRRVQRGR